MEHIEFPSPGGAWLALEAAMLLTMGRRRLAAAKARRMLVALAELEGAHCQDHGVKPAPGPAAMAEAREIERSCAAGSAASAGPRPGL